MEDDLGSAAGKIQAAFRGFNVRRRQPLADLRKIDTVRWSLLELQEKATDPAYIERICEDVKECRKLTEGIMALVLELDALQVFTKRYIRPESSILQLLKKNGVLFIV
jgi:hypothetical protein